MTRQPIQWAAEIVLHRDRMWRLYGGRSPPGAQAVASDLKLNLNFKGFRGNLAAGSAFNDNLSNNMVDNCITVHDRLIVYPDLVRMVMKHSYVWDKINKLHVLVYKAGSKQNIQWVLELLDDALSSGRMEGDAVSANGLRGAGDNKGMVAHLISKRVCRDYLLQHAQKAFASGWQPEHFVKMHEVFSSVPTFRSHMVTLTWQQSMKPSNIRFLEILEMLLVGEQYDDNLRTQVNNSRSPAEYHLHMSELKKDLDEVQELFNKEMEELQRGVAPPSAVSQQTAGLQPPTPEPVEKSELQKLAEVWYPKTPFAALGPFIIAAERRIKRTQLV